MTANLLILSIHVPLILLRHTVQYKICVFDLILI